MALEKIVSKDMSLFVVKPEIDGIITTEAFLNLSYNSDLKQHYKLLKSTQALSSIPSSLKFNPI